MFADDTLIYITGESSAEIEKKMNTVLSIVERWMNVNKLKMSADKTKYTMVRSVRREQEGDITPRCADGAELERVEKMKYLGTIIDDKLHFKDHCDYVLKKIGKKNEFLKQSR